MSTYGGAASAAINYARLKDRARLPIGNFIEANAIGRLRNGDLWTDGWTIRLPKDVEDVGVSNYLAAGGPIEFYLPYRYTTNDGMFPTDDGGTWTEYRLNDIEPYIGTASLEFHAALDEAWRIVGFPMIGETQQANVDAALRAGMLPRPLRYSSESEAWAKFAQEMQAGFTEYNKGAVQEGARRIAIARIKTAVLEAAQATTEAVAEAPAMAAEAAAGFVGDVAAAGAKVSGGVLAGLFKGSPIVALVLVLGVVAVAIYFGGDILGKAKAIKATVKGGE